MRKMRSVRAETIIRAPVGQVWDIWSAFGNVADYVPAIPKSYLITDVELGIGAQRRCDISDKQIVDEEITEWIPGESYTLAVTRVEGVPMDSLIAQCKVLPEGPDTRAVIDVQYRMKGVLDLLPIGWLMCRQAKDHLIGLRHHVETGCTVDPGSLKKLRKQYGHDVRG